MCTCFFGYVLLFVIACFHLGRKTAQQGDLTRVEVCAGVCEGQCVLCRGKKKRPQKTYKHGVCEGQCMFVCVLLVSFFSLVACFQLCHNGSR